MQVSHVNDHINHAVIGGSNKVRAFGVSDSAEFFHILSSTLYKDQILAVVRETLCNGWDAHIVSGRTDIPLKITLDHEKLVIRDFGPGIPDDLMEEVYGTYGNSTKKNDGEQTGGFGLGCKAPFAYAERFGVQSFHEGTRTIYALSKSSVEAAGKPGINTVLSLPTKETGLEVSINLKQHHDRSRFEALITQVASNGEIKVELNGRLLRMLPFSEIESNWLITSVPLAEQHHAINLRYGNVIYPVEGHADYQADYTKVSLFVANLNVYHSRSSLYRIVFQAPPHSISVQPSREGLSMQEHTIATIKTLLSGFLASTKAPIKQEMFRLLDESIAVTTKRGDIGGLLSDRETLPHRNREVLRTYNAKPFVTSAAAVAGQLLDKSYPSDFEGFRERDLDLRLKSVIELDFGKRGHIQELRQLIKGPTPKMKKQAREMARRLKWFSTGESVDSLRWYQRRILRPLARDLLANPHTQVKRMFVHTGLVVRNMDASLVAVSRYRPDSFAALMPLMRNIVVLTHTKSELTERIKNFPIMKKLGEATNVFVYHTPRAIKGMEETREFFKARGMILLDLTVEQPWDEPKVKRDIPVDRVKKPRVTGYPSLAGARSDLRATRVDNCFMEGAPRVQAPEFFIRVTPSRADDRSLELGCFQHMEASQIIDLYGDVCAVIKTDSHEEALKKQGLKNLDQFLLDHVLEQVTTAPNFLAYWPESIEKALGSGAGIQTAVGPAWTAANSLFKDQTIRNLMGLQSSLNRTELKVLKLWASMVLSSYKFRHVEEEAQARIDAAAKLVTEISVTQTAKDLAESMAKSVLFPAINIDGVRKLLKDTRDKPNELTVRTQLADLVKQALKG